MKETVKPRGKPLTAEQMKQVPHVTAKPQAKYAWAAGVAMSHFLEGLKQAKILARRCYSCERVLVPPRMFCERCYRTTDEWVELPGTGVIETFSVSFLDTDANRIQEPIFVGVLAFDGAPPHCGIMHYFGEVTSDEIHIGMPVEPVWKPKDARVGAITDIKYFRPREGARARNTAPRRKRR
jgi:uncharacterized OB-fold protein